MLQPPQPIVAKSILVGECLSELIVGHVALKLDGAEQLLILDPFKVDEAIRVDIRPGIKLDLVTRNRLESCGLILDLDDFLVPI